MIVVKVGGSLFDLPDLRQRLTRFLAPLQQVHLIPGGGAAADVVRQWDRLHRLGEETTHWIAIRSLGQSAMLLRALVPDPSVTVVDVETWLLQHDSIPHSWAVTTDSIAAHYARLMNATELFLLKSTDFTPGDWVNAARRGHVDAYFPTAAAGLNVRLFNLRAMH